ncbi:hypothetical protein LTR37_018333 [Vermiconidia calcicola]|uniref:Uncharacterized protein n=1 Tax=Vermiconidia calcicola TaxID=1690605 RepID=A0ACC3MH62_9PEZI|nr:hypothetical protein LTR37_018333 [Vermiconidia calcicola]
MATPEIQIFDTVELLETILFELPTRDLLLSQRVNKRWAAVVRSSRKLQQALFFESVSKTPLTLDIASTANCSVRANPLLQFLLDHIRDANILDGEKIEQCRARALRMRPIYDELDSMVEQIWESDGVIEIENDHLCGVMQLQNNQELDLLLFEAKQRSMVESACEHASGEGKDSENESESLPGYRVRGGGRLR